MAIDLDDDHLYAQLKNLRHIKSNRTKIDSYHAPSSFHQHRQLHGSSMSAGRHRIPWHEEQQRFLTTRKENYQVQTGGSVNTAKAGEVSNPAGEKKQENVPWWERLTATKTGNMKTGEFARHTSVRDQMDLQTREERLRSRQTGSTTNLIVGQENTMPRQEYVSPRVSEMFANTHQRRYMNRPKSANTYSTKRQGMYPM